MIQGEANCSEEPSLRCFDLFHKRDDGLGEKEHRIMLSTISQEVRYRKNDAGDYIPYFGIEFPFDTLKIIMIGPKCGKNAYGMIQSLMSERRIKQQVQVLNSTCPL